LVGLNDSFSDMNVAVKLMMLKELLSQCAQCELAAYTEQQFSK